MSLEKVQGFIRFIQDQKGQEQDYIKRLQNWGRFLDSNNPSDTSNPAYNSMRADEEARILEEIIATEKKRMSKKADQYDNYRSHVLAQEKCARLFAELADMAKEDDYQVTAHDLISHIGGEVTNIILQYPDSDVDTILKKVVKKFTE